MIAGICVSQVKADTYWAFFSVKHIGIMKWKNSVFLLEMDN